MTLEGLTYPQCDSRSMRRRFGLTLALSICAAVGLLASACSSSNSSSGTKSASGAGQAIPLKVTTLNLCNEISVWWAQEKGIFEKNHLDVSLVKSTGGAAALAAVQGGSADLAFTNPFSTMLATKSGINLRWVATAYGTPKTGDPASNAILVKQNSDIRTGKDLEGKTVAVNEVGGINQIITSQFVTDAGGDPSNVKFVALPFSELAGSVTSGRADAAQTPEQYANTPGVRSIGDPYMEVGHGASLVFAGYVGAAKFVDENETPMKSFLTSLEQADAAINDPANKHEKFKIESAHCGQDAKTLATDPENPYFATVPMDAMKRMAQILVDQGQIDKLPDVESLVPAYSRK